MITSAQWRLYAKKSQLLGKTLDVAFNRRDQALIMALKWSRLADQIDRDDATTVPDFGDNYARCEARRINDPRRVRGGEA
jgi:hypothetical protein